MMSGNTRAASTMMSVTAIMLRVRLQARLAAAVPTGRWEHRRHGTNIAVFGYLRERPWAASLAFACTGSASGRGLVGPTCEGSETGATTVERPTNLYGAAAPADRQPLDEDQLESRPRALGFSEVGQLRERAGTFQADAQWRGEDVVVVVDPNTGALSYEDDAVARD